MIIDCRLIKAEIPDERDWRYKDRKLTVYHATFTHSTFFRRPWKVSKIVLYSREIDGSGSWCLRVLPDYSPLGQHQSEAVRRAYADIFEVL